MLCCCPMYSGHQTTTFGMICGRTSRGHTGGRPPSFCGACLIFLSRKRFSRSFPSSTVKSTFVYARHGRLSGSNLGQHNARENPSSCNCAEIRTRVYQRQKVSRLPTEPLRRPVLYENYTLYFTVLPRSNEISLVSK